MEKARLEIELTKGLVFEEQNRVCNITYESMMNHR